MQKLISVRELAAWMDLSENRVYNLCQQGIVPHVRLGRTIRFNPTDMLEFLAQGGRGLSEN